jgi:hypothetical protein
MESTFSKFITMIGVNQAKEGYVFVQLGASSRCLDCEFHKVCVQNLEVGRIYKVTGLRENVFPCRLQGATMRVVEVVESEVKVALPSRLSIKSAVVVFKAQECSERRCENHGLCVPLGLVDGDRCVILQAGEKIPCNEDSELVKVVLRRIPSSRRPQQS